mgnify:CR=1 FL=1
MALLVTFVAIDKSNPPEAKERKISSGPKVTRAGARNAPFFRKKKKTKEPLTKNGASVLLGQTRLCVSVFISYHIFPPGTTPET